MEDKISQLTAEHDLKKQNLREAMRKLEEQQSMLLREYSRGGNLSGVSVEGDDAFQYDMVLRATNFHDLSTSGWRMDIPSQETREWFSACVTQMHKDDKLSKQLEELEKEGGLSGYLSPEILDAIRDNTDNNDNNHNMDMKKRGVSSYKERKEMGGTPVIPNHDQSFSIVGVMGFYDKGKTWILNKLMDTSFPSSKRVATEGISFCMTIGPSNTKWLILDTAGFGSPVSCKQHPLTRHYRSHSLDYCSHSLSLSLAHSRFSR